MASPPERRISRNFFTDMRTSRMNRKNKKKIKTKNTWEIAPRPLTMRSCLWCQPTSFTRVTQALSIHAGKVSRAKRLVKGHAVKRVCKQNIRFVLSISLSLSLFHAAHRSLSFAPLCILPHIIAFLARGIPLLKLLRSLRDLHAPTRPVDSSVVSS